MQAFRRYSFSPLQIVPLFLLLTGFLTVLALWCQPNHLWEVGAVFLEKPVLIALNALPVGLLLLSISFLFRNLFYGAAAVNLTVCALSIANRVKIQVRDEPVFPRDLSLLKEVGSALGTYEISFPLSVLAVVLGVTLLLTILGRLTESPFPRHWPARLTGCAGGFAVLWILIVTVFSSDNLYDRLGASEPYRLSVVFNENGFLYNFCRQFTKYQVDRPAGYNRARAEAWDREELPPSEGKNVSVVIVMDEAFSDITDDPAFAFSPEEDPLPNLHAIQADPHGLALRLVVPGFAGGTANTEFDVLTGMQTNSLGSGTTSAMRTVNRNLDSLFRVFGGEGYRTSFFHPGDDWFYNRENVYRWFGAEKTLFIDEMQDPEYKGRWVTDQYLAGLIEAEFEQSASENRPLFHYSTTIQNHMGYPRSKYGDGYDYPPVSLSVSVPDDVRSMLEVYVEGARDADSMLGQLREFFAARPEPAVLVFFGDHLPYLGDGRQCYAALGMEIAAGDTERQNYFCIYETPCVLWANEAAAEGLDWDSSVENLELPENGRLSAAFLGAVLLELTGRGRITPWEAFLNHLRRQIPVIQGNVWMTPDETVIDAASVEKDDERAANIAKWRQWSYYKLEQKELRENS